MHDKISFLKSDSMAFHFKYFGSAFNVCAYLRSIFLMTIVIKVTYVVRPLINAGTISKYALHVDSSSFNDNLTDRSQPINEVMLYIFLMIVYINT